MISFYFSTYLLDFEDPLFQTFGQKFIEMVSIFTFMLANKCFIYADCHRL